MKRNIKKGFILLTAMLVFLTGCQKQEEVVVSEKKIPVEILETKAAVYDKRITVPGVVASR